MLIKIGSLLWKSFLFYSRRAAFAAVLLTLLCSAAHAVVVQTTNRTMNAGTADFGAGNHSAGSPSGNATITFDWSIINGQLISTGRVRGTLYWDSLFSSGCSRLTIRFRNPSNANIAIRQVEECGPGGDANNSQNKTFVDQSFGSIDLSSIILTVAEIRNGAAINPLTITISQVTQKSFPVTINNGKADFGNSGHHFGRPDQPGFISFRRNFDGTVTGGVDGILYYDSFDSASCSRMRIDYRNPNAGILDTSDHLNCGPGGDANSGANQLFITEGFTSGVLSNIRILVEDTAIPQNGVLQIYSFAGLGDFEVEPVDAIIQKNEFITYTFIWSMPEPLNWHDLNTLDLRIMNGSDPILHIRFNENGNLLSVLNEATGQFGPEFPIGSDNRLQTRYASLDLRESTVGAVNSVLGTGPNSPTVKLGLALKFKPSAAGNTYRIEVAASDDLENEDLFTLAGTLTVVQ